MLERKRSECPLKFPASSIITIAQVRVVSRKRRLLVKASPKLDGKLYILFIVLLSLQSPLISSTLPLKLKWNIKVDAKPFNQSLKDHPLHRHNPLEAVNYDIHNSQTKPREQKGGFFKPVAFQHWRGGGYEFIIETPDEKKKKKLQNLEGDGDANQGNNTTNALISNNESREEESTIVNIPRQQQLIKVPDLSQNPKKQRKDVISSSTSSSTKDTGASSSHGRQKYHISICSIQGKRAYMEDEYYNNEDGSFVAVMDGHGGSAVSRYIRQNLYARYLQAKTAVMNDATREAEENESEYDQEADDDDSKMFPMNSKNSTFMHEGSQDEGNMGDDGDIEDADSIVNDDGNLVTRISAIIPDFSELDYHTKTSSSISSSSSEYSSTSSTEKNKSSSAPSSKLTKKMWNEKLMDAGNVNTPSKSTTPSSTSHNQSAAQNIPTLPMRIRALTSAFETIDSEVQKISHWSYQGSTAVAVLLCNVRTHVTQRNSKVETHKIKDSDGADCNEEVLNQTTKKMLISANVGDSRAVLCRAGKAIDLTRDHKPNDPMERSRIESLGGRVDWFGPVDELGNPVTHIRSNSGKRRSVAGVYRINRNLALSRAIGDRSERPLVSSQVDIESIELNECDEFIILATDGLWDVWDSQEAVNFCKRVIARFAADKSRKDSSERVRRKLSRILVKEALKRGSMDNITVVIIWLS